MFLPYIKSYTAAFAGQAITTQQWQDHLYAFWREAGGEDAVKKLDSIDWKSWLHGESTDLPVDLQYDSSLVDQVRPASLCSRQRPPVSLTPGPRPTVAGLRSRRCLDQGLQDVDVRRLQQDRPLGPDHGPGRRFPREASGRPRPDRRGGPCS